MDHKASLQYKRKLDVTELDTLLRCNSDRTKYLFKKIPYSSFSVQKSLQRLRISVMYRIDSSDALELTFSEPSKDSDSKNKLYPY